VIRGLFDRFPDGHRLLVALSDNQPNAFITNPTITGPEVTQSFLHGFKVCLHHNITGGFGDLLSANFTGIIDFINLKFFSC